MTGVNAALTPTRRRAKRRRTYEATDYVAFCRRIIRSAGKRVARDGDPADLAELVGMRDDVELAIAASVAGLRDCGYSWGQIGAELGLSRQAVQQRYGRAVAS